MSKWKSMLMIEIKQEPAAEDEMEYKDAVGKGQQEAMLTVISLLTRPKLTLVTKMRIRTLR